MIAQQVNHACITLQLTSLCPVNAMLHVLMGVTAEACVLGIKTYFSELHMTGDCLLAKFQTRCAVKAQLFPASITTMHDMCYIALKPSSAHAGSLYIVLRWWGRWGWGWHSDRGRRYALRLPLGLRLQAGTAHKDDTSRLVLMTYTLCATHTQVMQSPNGNSAAKAGCLLPFPDLRELHQGFPADCRPVVRE